MLKPDFVFERLCVVIRQAMVKVPAHAAFICCFICKLISHLIAVYAYMRFYFEQDCLIPALNNGLWQSSTVNDSDDMLAAALSATDLARQAEKNEAFVNWSGMAWL